MFQITIAIVIAAYLLDISMLLLNYKHRNQPIPQNVQDVYKENEYQKWLQYTFETYRVSIMASTLSAFALIFFLILDLFPMLANLANDYSSDMIIQTIIFLGLYSAVNFVLRIGFQWYRVFNIEERYGFNRSTPKTFIVDQLKSLLLSVVLGGGLLYILLYLYQQLNHLFFLLGWLLIVLFFLTVNLLYTRILIRIFNKLTPLPEGELYDHIQTLTRSTGYEIKKISVMNASKRSTKINAFFSGFGKFKHIVLYDTLLEKCGVGEITSVLAHEIGHARNKDVLKNILTFVVQTGLIMLLLAWFLSADSLMLAFGFNEMHIGFSLVLFSILIRPLDVLISIPLNAHSRKAEYRADNFAAKAGYRQEMINALKILARENFSNLTPHPFVVRLTYTHPPVSQRIEALSEEME
ncbi:MAG: M48 family metallopeptidase [Eubacteriales bacterium]|nr:M48 family metallopeptidase [Eubacteriales bacterium]